MSKVLGIDLGTGNSCFCVYENGSANVITNSDGAKTTPSVVYFNPDGTRTVGAVAKRQAVMNPKNVVHSAKRLIGKTFAQVKDLQKLLAYEIGSGKDGRVVIKAGGKEFTPEEVSAAVLSKLKTDAEAYLGEEIKDAVITVPAYFGDSERQATKDAGKIAGLNVLRIINEPTAACLAYGLDKGGSKTIAVGDIGCGTSDISILDYGDGVFEVLATNGDALLGGDDLDEALMKYVACEFERENGVNLLNDSQAKARLKEACEKAKCELSTASSTNINLPFITANQNGPLHLAIDISRSKFEQIISPIIDKFETKVRECIKDSGKTVDQISDIVMVGGTTRIPYVQEFFKRIFGKDVNKTVNPDEIVATGAAIQGAVLGGDKSAGDMVLLDVVSLSYGIETLGGVFTKMIEKGTTIPAKKTDIFSTAVDSQPAITVRVFQGERTKAVDNKLIGNFNLDGIPPAPRGVPKIEITYDVDANGILTISAKDLGTGKENHITISGNSGLSDDEIKRMVQDAEDNKEKDQKFKEEQELLNSADAIMFSVEKSLESASDGLKAEIKPLLKKAKELRASKDIDGLKEILKELEKAAMKIGQEVYQNSTNNGSGSSVVDDILSTAEKVTGKKNGSDGPIDAEIVD